MARVLRPALGVAACLVALSAAAGAAELSPAELWRIRIAETREWKLWIATLAALWGALEVGLAAFGRGDRARLARDGVLVALCLATLFAWWHPYRGSLRAWLHVGDAYHYFIGAKYFQELRYTRLYACTNVADAEDGLAGPLARAQTRNLETNQLESAMRAVRQPGECKRHFTPERWRGFKQDLQYFRKKLNVPLWFKIRVDHGYNPPPTWTVLGSLLAHTTPVANRTQFFFLTSLDPLLLALMFGAIAWGFGPRVMGVALVYWGTNQPASWEWVGGSIVRFDWLAAAAASLACLKRGHPVAAGLLLAWATGIRVFPGAIAAGVAGAAALGMWRERRPLPTPTQLRFGVAFAAGLVTLVAVSAAWVGPSAWVEFVENSRLHVGTDSMNRTGLRPLLAYRHETRLAATIEPDASDPFARWRAERSATDEARRPYFHAISGAYLILLAFALRRPPDWVAGLLGLGAVGVLLEFGSYYFAFLLFFAFQAGRRPDVMLALLLLGAVSWWVGTWGGPDRDVVVAHTSLAILSLVVYATAREAFGTQRE